MKSKITTTLRQGILDKQGEAVQKALVSLGFDNVKSVRIGKTVELDHEEDADLVEITKSIYNEVMEEYVIEKDIKDTSRWDIHLLRDI